MNSTLPEPIAVTLLVIEVLEQLQLPYVIGGSLASAQHGTARSTLDSDLVVALTAEHVPFFVSALNAAFYVDQSMALTAVEQQRSFNLIHFETMFKVDLFIAGDGIFERSQIERRVPQVISQRNNKTIYILSAEDTILAKLRWYRMGGEQSERQWRDVVGVAKVQANSLDQNYLQKMGAQIGVSDLLKRLFEVSGE